MQIARVREANIRAELQRIEHKLDKQSQAQATLQSLESELGANKQLYETFLERLKETDILENTEPQAEARIISRATESGAPYFPNTRLMIAAAIAFSAVVGMALAFVAEFMDSGFRSTSQPEAQSGVHALGMIPALKRSESGGKLPHEFALARPNSIYGEAIRSIRMGLLLSSVDQAPRSVLVTSSIPGEGKTTTAISVAITAAKSGQRVIILDCDLRLSDYLAG